VYTETETNTKIPDKKTLPSCVASSATFTSSSAAAATATAATATASPAAAATAAAAGVCGLVYGAAHVLVQMGLLLEGLAANTAGVRSLVVVHSRLVAHEAVAECESLSAARVLAGVRAVLIVDTGVVLVELRQEESRPQR
jgi:hypothetical protein